jgi:hypothetical protein
MVGLERQIGGGLPYALSELATTIWEVGIIRRQASSRLTVPSAFTRKASTGIWAASVTCVNAPRWKTK